MTIKMYINFHGEKLSLFPKIYQNKECQKEGNDFDMKINPEMGMQDK